MIRKWKENCFSLTGTHQHLPHEYHLTYIYVVYIKCTVYPHHEATFSHSRIRSIHNSAPQHHSLSSFFSSCLGTEYQVYDHNIQRGSGSRSDPLRGCVQNILQGEVKGTDPKLHEARHLINQLLKPVSGLCLPHHGSVIVDIIEQSAFVESHDGVNVVLVGAAVKNNKFDRFHSDIYTQCL